MSGDRDGRNAWYRQKRRELVVSRGSRCEHRFPSSKRCIARGTRSNPLEFAHLVSTGLKGEGRGQNHRIRDVLRHPDNYALLCRRHHIEHDRGRPVAQLTGEDQK